MAVNKVISVPAPLAGLQLFAEANYYLALLIVGLCALGLLLRDWRRAGREELGVGFAAWRKLQHAVPEREEPPASSVKDEARRIPSAPGSEAHAASASQAEAAPAREDSGPLPPASPSSFPSERPSSSSRRSSQGAAACLEQSSGSYKEAAQLPLPQELPLPAMPSSAPPKLGLVGLPVLLHIYDVSHEFGIQHLNTVLAHHLSAIKLGGVFHAGVEVLGKEWSYGYCASGTGVSPCEPRQHPMHHFRETMPLQNTRLSEEEVLRVIKRIAEEYQGRDYHLVQRNCCHFAEDLCHRLGAGELPSWLYRLARIGSGLMEVSQGLADMVGDIRLSRSVTAPVLEDAHQLRWRHGARLGADGCE